MVGDAAKLLKKTEKELSPAQVKRAKKLAKTWLAKQMELKI